MVQAGKELRFRNDINGMRAVAVAGVVAYHFQLAGVRGGFVGVDVFFVISGFLMTQIICGRLEAGRFTFAEFYEARVHRIVPALAAAVFCVMAAGYVLLDPLQLEVLAKDALFSLLFLSNFLYIQQGGYFAVAANQNWLLHTWSLSVEWQFYILYPILLSLLYRFRANKIPVSGVLLLLAAVSLGRMITSSHAGPGSLTVSFYMIDSRAWEFLAGALCALAPPLPGWTPRRRIVVHAVGLLIVAASMFVLESKTAVWPSVLTCLPVAGAGLVLIADVRMAGWAVFRPVQLLGRWSYSIYLWHWPLAAMCSFFGYWSPSVRIVAALTSIVLGFVSFQLIERRATNALWLNRTRLMRLGIPTFAAVFSLAVFAFATHGLESIRFAFQPQTLAALKDYRRAETDWMSQNDCPTYVKTSTGFALCKLGKASSQDTLVIGDSFAEQVIPRYTGSFPSDHVGVTFLVREGCIPMPGVERIPFGSKCNQWVGEAYKYAESEDFKKVVFIALWVAYDRGQICLLDADDCGSRLDDDAFSQALDADYRRMAEVWRKLKSQGKQIVVVEEIPFGEGDPAGLYQKALHGPPVQTLTRPFKDFEDARAQTHARLQEATHWAGVTLVDPAQDLCVSGECPIVVHGRTLYRDAFHLRASVMKDERFSMFDRYIMPGSVTSSALN